MRGIILNVTGSQCNQNVEVGVLYQVEQLVLCTHTLGDFRCQIVVNQFAGHSRDRSFSCRIDIQQDHIIGQRQSFGKFLIEIACAGIQMRLEYRGDFLVRIEFLDGADALLDFFRVVGIVCLLYTSDAADEL